MCLWAKFSPRFELGKTEKPDGHITYDVKCLLYQGEQVIGEGVGCCSSMESKYRWRWVFPSELPEGSNKEYLPHRFDKGFTKYRIDNENPADQANTILKIAKKRAFVDAILTRTGASRIFTQDLEEEQEQHWEGIM